MTQEGRELMLAAKEKIEEAALSTEELLENLGIPKAVFVQVATNALIKTPLLAKCTPNSLKKACLYAAQAGMLPDGYSSALIPRKKRGVLEASFEPMVGGLLMHARKAIPNAAISAHSVWTDDEFSVAMGTKPDITHIPDENADIGWANLRAVYATVFYPGNAVPEFEVTFRKEIEWFKSLSASAKGPWATHGPEMAEVRPLKRLLKRMPVGPELLSILNRSEQEEEEAWDTPGGDGVIDVPSEEVKAAEPEAEAEDEDEDEKKEAAAAAKRKRAAKKKKEQEAAAEPEEVDPDDDADDLRDVDF